MEKIEVLVPIAIPLNLRARFWSEIITQRLQFFSAKWVSTASRMPSYAARLKEYCRSFKELKLKPIIPYENRFKEKQIKKGRLPNLVHYFPKPKYHARIQVRANGICTIIVEQHIRGKVDAGRIKIEKNAMRQEARKIAIFVLKRIKSHLAEILEKDFVLSESMRKIAFGEPFTVYYYSGEHTSIRKEIFEKLTNRAFPSLNGDIFDISRNMLIIFFSNVSNPKFFVERSREGIALALGIRNFIDKCQNQENFLHAKDLDFNYLVHFLNPFVFIGSSLAVSHFFPSLPKKWFRRICRKLSLEADFKSMLIRFTQNLNSQVCQLQLLIALKNLKSRYNFETIQGLSPITRNLSSEEKTVLLIVMEIQKRQSFVLRNHVLLFIKNEIFPIIKEGNQEKYHEIMDAIREIERKGEKNPLSPLTNWNKLEEILNQLVKKKYLIKEYRTNLVGKRKKKPAYGIWDKNWQFSEELLELIQFNFPSN